MHTITIETVGSRFRLIREHLKLSQVMLAAKLDCNQNAVSNFELGKGASIDLLLDLLNFYSGFVYTDSVFSERFVLVPKNGDGGAHVTQNNAAAAEVLEQTRALYKEKIGEAVKAANGLLDEGIGRALALLAD